MRRSTGYLFITNNMLLLKKAFVVGIWSLLALSGFAQVGSCGESVLWTLKEGTLTISGYGDMENYWFNGVYTSEKIPSWYPFKEDIKHVIFEAGVTSVGAHSFCDYAQLETVTFSDDIKTIGPGAFKNCTSISNLTLPANLEELTDYSTGLYSQSGSAFEGCTGITVLYIPESVNTIGGGTFKNCRNLKKVIWAAQNAKLLSENRLTVDPNIFFGCPIDEIEFTPTARFIRAKLFSSNLISSLKTSGNIEICEIDAINLSSPFFADKKDGALMIDHVLYAYYHNVPSAFTISLPNGTTSITENAIKNNQLYLVGLSVPESFYYMAKDALKGCTSLSTLEWNAKKCEFSSTPTFSSSLFDVSFGENVEEIGSNMLRGCSGIKKIELPANLKVIGSEAFGGCSGLKELIIPDNVTTLEGQTGLTSLETLYLGKSITQLGYLKSNVSKVIWNIEECEVSNFNSNMNPIFEKNFSELIIGPDVETIPDYCFQCQTDLKKIDFNQAHSLKHIGNWAFRKCGTISEFYLPKGVESMGPYVLSATVVKTAFFPESLVDMDLYNANFTDTVIMANNNILSGVYSGDATLYVPDPQMFIKNSGHYSNGPAEGKVNPLVAFPENVKNTFCIVDGKVDFSDLSVQSNLLGYTINLDFEANGLTPGKYSTARAYFSGKNEFSAVIPFEYEIVEDLSSISETECDSSESQYWSLDGKNVNKPKSGNIYIMKTKGRVSKILK